MIESHGLCCHFYANDSQIYGYCRPHATPDLTVSLSACIDDVVLWSATSHRLHQLPQLPLRVCSDKVVPTTAVRDLGVYIDADLSMKTHLTK